MIIYWFGSLNILLLIFLLFFAKSLTFRLITVLYPSPGSTQSLPVPKCSPVSQVSDLRTVTVCFYLQIFVCRPTSSVAKCLCFYGVLSEMRHAFRPIALFSNLQNGVIWWLKFYTLLSQSRQLLRASVPRPPSSAPPEKKILSYATAFWYQLTQVVLEKRPFNGSSSSSLAITNHGQEVKCISVCTCNTCQLFLLRL